MSILLKGLPVSVTLRNAKREANLGKHRTDVPAALAKLYFLFNRFSAPPSSGVGGKE